MNFKAGDTLMFVESLTDTVMIRQLNKDVEIPDEYTYILQDCPEYTSYMLNTGASIIVDKKNRRL